MSSYKQNNKHVRKQVAGFNGIVFFIGRYPDKQQYMLSIQWDEINTNHISVALFLKNERIKIKQAIV